MTYTDTLSARHLRRPRARTLFGRLVEWLIRADASYRQRCSLDSLNSHQLRDIGVTEAERDAMVRKTVWDAPVVMTQK